MIRCEDRQRGGIIRGSLTTVMVLGIGLLMIGCSAPKLSTEFPSKLPPEMLSFITNKEAHARALARKLDLKISPDVWAFFATARTAAPKEITNAFEQLDKKARPYAGARVDPRFTNPAWQTVVEVELAVDAFADGDPKYSLAFGRGVIDSIPPGSIYFGGTDPGRGLVTAFSKSHADGDPFFTLTQNQLADYQYLDYLRATYREKIHTPSMQDSKDNFEEYLKDAGRRKKLGQLRPGEQVDIVPGPDGHDRVQVSGQVSVMAVNGLMARKIFDANPDREFYIEESFPLEWMYPYLSPHGYIFKLNRQPLDVLPEEAVQKDHEFWVRQQKQLIGDWLTPETPINDLCSFARTVFGRKDFSTFTGDRLFVENEYAIKLYSKLRTATGGMYWWRASHSSNAKEKERMTAEAGFAYQQAFAMCPFSPEVTYHLVEVLTSKGNTDDAMRLAETALSLSEDDEYLKSLVSQLKRPQASKDE